MKNPVVIQFLIWQFIDMPKAILAGWKNFLAFGLNYFSIPLLLKTYFSRWRRYGGSYGKIFEFSKNFEMFLFNTMSRGIGMIMRTFFIIAGIATEVSIFIIGLIAVSVWFVLPFILIIGLFFGLGLLV